jgi:hypothetical protein
VIILFPFFLWGDIGGKYIPRCVLGPLNLEGKIVYGLISLWWGFIPAAIGISCFSYPKFDWLFWIMSYLTVFFLLLIMRDEFSRSYSKFKASVIVFSIALAGSVIGFFVGWVIEDSLT